MIGDNDVSMFLSQRVTWRSFMLDSSANGSFSTLVGVWLAWKFGAGLHQ
jgi:hypothetical protein